jgi:AraC-like DNA-binding protein
VTATVAVIRGFALLPTISFFARRGIAAESFLEDAGLSAELMDNPMRPVPLVLVAGLLRNAARQIGPDLPCQIVSDAEDLELAVMGKIALGTLTARQALARIVAALPYYCSHEHISLQNNSGRTEIKEFFAHKFDQETAHLLLQYAAAMIDRLCAMSGAAAPRFSRMEIPPHPEFGLSHLNRWFGPGLIASKSRSLSVLVENSVLDRPFPSVARRRFLGREMPRAPTLRGDGTLSDSVRHVLAGMIESGQIPSIGRLVDAAGMSRRSLQRALQAEGSSYSEALAWVRQTESLKRLNDRQATISSIAFDLGYSDKASLTRAFRRWTGKAPSQARA